MSIAAKLLSVILLAQAGLFWGCSRSEVIPVKKPLLQMAREHATWKSFYEAEVDPAQQVVLKADDTIVRMYQRPESPLRASLYVASFLSQRGGRAPHSPQNCLPGAGYTWQDESVAHIQVDGRAEPIEAKRHLMVKGDSKSIVYYWYQSRDRTVASEYWAKVYVVMDALRSNRTDSALVRVIVEVQNNDVAGADKAALDFMRHSYQDIRKQLPS